MLIVQYLWVCLICSNVGCGRYKAGHSLQHQKKTGHHFSKDLYSGRIWDYITDIFVHRLIQDNKDNSFLNLPEGQTLQDESQNSEKIQRIDNQIWEYCYVISQQMEEQRKFFESQIKEAEEEFKGEKEYKQLEEIQQEKEKKLNELRQNNSQIKQEILKNEKNFKFNNIINMLYNIIFFTLQYIIFQK
ncbi:hypothetical protein PPERSA_06658 [Pseudocohnilembus persalinus]|uniref:UBP-type domain-containing protein n=1 Tax=Pseudocohnilembus persalinus TaxID=266149 RepID=A0A0V0QSM1_PSEPJ|nr:hypothetical protein PPERSA_06658 [Pseudocohnilembus persalinus]|eukprot:KRX05024.1 hypothetical protein PPERSA_06658 [Pseudocohnilembus persalinus]